MGCWGITAFESDAGLDAVDDIRKSLPKNGKLELGKIIEMFKGDGIGLLDAENGESHSSSMALAEIAVKFMDHEIENLDYDDEWAVKDNKFANITSFSASKESIQWLRDYLNKTLESAKRNASDGVKWNGWFQEQDWKDWQTHVSTLIGRFDELLTYPEHSIELTAVQQHQNNHIMKM